MVFRNNHKMPGSQLDEHEPPQQEPAAFVPQDEEKSADELPPIETIEAEIKRLCSREPHFGQTTSSLTSTRLW